MGSTIGIDATGLIGPEQEFRVIPWADGDAPPVRAAGTR